MFLPRPVLLYMYTDNYNYIIYSDCYLLGVEDHSGFKVSYNYIHILNSLRICVTIL